MAVTTCKWLASYSYHIDSNCTKRQHLTVLKNYADCCRRLNPATGKLGMSYAVFKMSDLRPLGKLILSVFSLLRLVQVETSVGEDKKSTRVNNFTLINFVIKMLGPLHERTLTVIMLLVQVSLNVVVSKVVIHLGPRE